MRGRAVLLLGVLMVASGFQDALAQRGGMGRGGRGGMSRQFQEAREQMQALRAFPVEVLWSTLSFGIDVPDSQLIVMMPGRSETEC